MFLRLTNGFERLSDSNLAVRASSIVAAITDNPNFPDPKPSLAVMQSTISEFRQAAAVALSGTNVDKALKNVKKEELINKLHSLAYYVLFIADGDEVVAQSSGFTIAKQASTLPDITVPTNPQLRDGANTGELVLSFNRVIGAKSYMYQYTLDPIANDSSWKTETGTVSKAKFAKLESGKRYWCRVVAVGTNGQGVYSNPISRIVQ